LHPSHSCGRHVHASQHGIRYLRHSEHLSGHHQQQRSWCVHAHPHHPCTNHNTLIHAAPVSLLCCFFTCMVLRLFGAVGRPCCAGDTQQRQPLRPRTGLPSEPCQALAGPVLTSRTLAATDLDVEVP
jgi:hypothetical protein